MRVSFFVREAMRSMRRNAVPSFAAIATVLVTMLMLGLFIPVVQATSGAASSVSKRVLVDVYLKTGAKPSDVARVTALLKKTRHVGGVQYISRATAYAEQRRLHPQLYALLGRNPLPDTFRVTPDKPSDALALARALAPPAAAGGGTVPIDPSIATIKNRRNDTKKILTVTRMVKVTAAVLGLVLISASILLIANTIRLSLFARKREVEVMKLVGATDWFIRWPFVIEGVIVGALGAVGAVGLLVVGKVLVLDHFFGDVASISVPHTIPFAGLLAIVLAGGVAVSAVGSGISLRRFLRV
jgi:cell division transport system permease protein